MMITSRCNCQRNWLRETLPGAIDFYDCIARIAAVTTNTEYARPRLFRARLLLGRRRKLTLPPEVGAGAETAARRLCWQAPGRPRAAPRADRLDAAQEGQGRPCRWRLPDLSHPGSHIRALIVKFLGDPPNEFHQELIDTAGGTLTPIGRLGGMSWDHLMGIEPVNGRDIFSRIVYGSRISLLIAFLATCCLWHRDHARDHLRFRRRLDGHLHQPADGRVSGLPAAGLGHCPGRRLPGPGVRSPGQPAADRVADLHHRILQLALYRADHPGQTLSLREREFVESARSIGARRGYILRTEMLPNLIAPILVYSTLLIPTNILFEAALSFLGVGIRPPTPSWGGMLSDAVVYYTQPHFMFWPGMAIFVTVLAFNLFGDGLRDALDPRANR